MMPIISAKNGPENEGETQARLHPVFGFQEAGRCAISVWNAGSRRAQERSLDYCAAGAGLRRRDRGALPGVVAGAPAACGADIGAGRARIAAASADLLARDDTGVGGPQRPAAVDGHSRGVGGGDHDFRCQTAGRPARSRNHDIGHPRDVLPTTMTVRSSTTLTSAMVWLPTTNTGRGAGGRRCAWPGQAANRDRARARADEAISEDPMMAIRALGAVLTGKNFSCPRASRTKVNKMIEKPPDLARAVVI